MTIRPTRRAAAGVVGGLTLLAALAGPAGAGSEATERVSVASDGTEGNSDSLGAAISADGRHLAFTSWASNLVPGDTNGANDVFAHDRQTGTTERVSVASDGTEGNGPSTAPALSADGRHVAFQSSASNLVPGDTNGTNDVFVHDRQTGVTERVSVATDGTQGNATSISPAISGDGRHVAFVSWASNLVPGITNPFADVFVHDRQTGVTERVSVATDGTQGNSGSLAVAISADGRHVAFHSTASTLAPDVTNGVFDVYVHDRQTRVTDRVSVASDGTEGDGLSSSPSVSADGRYVSFHSLASNLVPDDGNDTHDVFVHDRQTGTTERVSVASDGAEGNDASHTVAISADGRHVAFTSWASNLVAGDSNGTNDVFVHDRATATTERVSVAGDGTEGNDASETAAISADGRQVAFHSVASNLVPGDTNGTYDVFVHDRGEPAVALVWRGPMSAIRGTTVTQSAILVDQKAGVRLADRPVRLTVGDFEAEVVTDADGIASVVMPVSQPYGPQPVVISFAGDEDDKLDPAETSAVFTVLWEHEFADGGNVLWVNTITSELQFEAPGDISGVKTDPDMTVETQPTGDTVIRIDYHDDDLTVVGRFFLERETFAAVVRTPSGAYLLSDASLEG